MEWSCGCTHFAGEADALAAGQKLFFGYGQRSQLQVFERVLAKLGVADVQIVPCQLTETHWPHLDTAFCPLNDQLALWFPEAFSAESRERMAKELELLAVPSLEAERFVCNAVVVGTHVILPSGNGRTAALLAEHGFEARPVEVGEFMKFAGGCKKLALTLT